MDRHSNHPEVEIILLRLVRQQGGRLRLQRNGQLQKRRERDVDHALFDLGDLAVIDAAGIRHFAEAESLFFPELSQIISELF